MFRAGLLRCVDETTAPPSTGQCKRRSGPRCGRPWRSGRSPAGLWGVEHHSGRSAVCADSEDPMLASSGDSTTGVQPGVFTTGMPGRCRWTCRSPAKSGGVRVTIVIRATDPRPPRVARPLAAPSPVPSACALPAEAMPTRLPEAVTEARVFRALPHGPAAAHSSRTPTSVPSLRRRKTQSIGRHSHPSDSATTREGLVAPVSRTFV